MTSKDSGRISENQPVANANNYFGLQLYKMLAKEGKNVFFSPFSLSTALGMLFYGARNKTMQEMKTVLGYEIANIKNEEIKSFFQQLLSDLECKTEAYTLTYANSMFYQKELDVREEYKSLLFDFFKAVILEVDFKDEKATEEINSWVSEKTNNMIPKLLDFLDPSTVMVILNAVYFKGSWLKPFDAENTSLQNFNIRGEKDNYKKVQTMFMTKRFMFVEEDNYKALQLPYKGGDISMLILLPDNESNLEEFENSLCPTFLCDLTKNMWEQTVSVALPKFELEYSKSLKESFLSLGLESIFCQTANLEGISETGNLLVSNIIHKAVLVVNEVGSEAAAVSEIEIVPYCMSPDFYADHPFMFVIYNVKSNLILFMGRVNDL